MVSQKIVFVILKFLCVVVFVLVLLLVLCCSECLWVSFLLVMKVDFLIGFISVLQIRFMNSRLVMMYSVWLYIRFFVMLVVSWFLWIVVIRNGLKMLVVDQVVSSWLWIVFIICVLNRFVRYVGMVVKLLLYMFRIMQIEIMNRFVVFMWFQVGSRQYMMMLRIKNVQQVFLWLILFDSEVQNRWLRLLNRLIRLTRLVVVVIMVVFWVGVRFVVVLVRLVSLLLNMFCNIGLVIEIIVMLVVMLRNSMFYISQNCGVFYV